MSIAQLLKLLFVGQPFLAVARERVWLSVLTRLRRLHGLLLGLIYRRWRRPTPPPTPPPPPPPGKDHADGDHHYIRSSLTSPSPLSPYTVVFDGASIPLKEAVFSINPVSPSDSVRNPSPSPAPSLRNGSYGSQVNLLSVPSHPIASGRNSFAGSRSSISVHALDPQETVDEPQRLPQRQDTLLAIEVVGPPDDSLYPAVPSETRRYKDRKKIKKKQTNIILSPTDYDRKRFHRGLVLPDGWTRHTHPEGGCYFYHPVLRIYTDNEIYNPKELAKIKAKITAIEVCKTTIDAFPSDADIVLNIYGDKPEDTQCYCVNHAHRMIFFLSEFHAEWLETWGEVKGAYSRHHLLHELETQYWHFVHLYPDSIKLSQEVIDDLKDDLFFFNGDVTTSPYSTSPYSSVEITNLLNILPMLEGHVKCQTSTAGSVEFIARIMMLICHNRFLNFYGEPCARLERDFSVYGSALFPRTLLLRSVSLLLFSAPDVHLTRLQKMWADEILHKGVWKETMSKFASEWQELVAFATIMLNANVAFLAISSVDNTGPSRSWAQIFSYVSTIANLACMILGLLLMRQNRSKRQETTAHVYKYLKKQYSKLTGLEALAIMFSLPHASLMWGMTSFSIAFSLMCLRKADTLTRIVVSISLVLAAIYIFWCIGIAWETNPKDTSHHNRSWAYSQNAELKEDPEEDEGNNGPPTAAVSETDSTPPRPRPQIPGITTIMNRFSVPRNNPDVERGQTDLHDLASGNRSNQALATY